MPPPKMYPLENLSLQSYSTPDLLAVTAGSHAVCRPVPLSCAAEATLGFDGGLVPSLGFFVALSRRKAVAWAFFRILSLCSAQGTRAADHEFISLPPRTLWPLAIHTLLRDGWSDRYSHIDSVKLHFNFAKSLITLKNVTLAEAHS